VTTGGRNTAIGAGTGRGITTGGYNTIIGAAVTGLAANLTYNIIIADGGGNIKAQHDGTNWNLQGMVQLGGTSASYPALKRSTTAVLFRLADDSAYAPIYAAGGNFLSSVSINPGDLTLANDGFVQVSLTNASDSYYYPMFALTRQRGTLASPADVSAGDYTGAVNTYARYGGVSIGVTSFNARIRSFSGSYIKGQWNFNVSAGVDGGANYTAFSANSDYVIFYPALVMFAGTTSSYPALKRSSTGIEVRLADDSAYTYTIASAYYLSNQGILGSSSDGVLKLLNNAGTDFGRLQFGGTTSSFPALKRSSAELHVRLADDSDWATIKFKDAYEAGRSNAIGYPISYTPTITVDSGSVTTTSAAAHYSIVGKLVTILYELDVTPSATPSVIYATIPINSSSLRTTMVQSYIWKVGTGSDTALLKAVVNASDSKVCLYRRDLSGTSPNWAALQYQIVFQVSYYIS